MINSSPIISQPWAAQPETSPSFLRELLHTTRSYLAWGYGAVPLSCVLYGACVGLRWMALHQTRLTVCAAVAVLAYRGWVALGPLLARRHAPASGHPATSVSELYQAIRRLKQQRSEALLDYSAGRHAANAGAQRLSARSAQRYTSRKNDTTRLDEQ